MQIGDTAHLTLFSLILMRMSGFILFNPIFGRRNIPTIVKSSMIFILTVAVYSFSRETAFVVESPVEYYMLLLKEFAAGYVLGLVADLFFMVISFAGYIIDFQMGMSMATVYDPQSNSQMAITGNVMQTFFVLLFFAVDGHLALMKILLTWRDCSLRRLSDYKRTCVESGRDFHGMHEHGGEILNADSCGGISCGNWSGI